MKPRKVHEEWLKKTGIIKPPTRPPRTKKAPASLEGQTFLFGEDVGSGSRKKKRRED